MTDTLKTPREYLQDNILLFDGGMGTYFAQLFRDPLGKCELANLRCPERILAIHEAYIQAGAMAIKTNTFGANLPAMEGDHDLLSEVIAKGWEIANQAADNSSAQPRPFVFADIGPIPPDKDGDIMAAYREIIDIFLELGASSFLFETFSNDKPLAELAAYIKSKRPDSFIIVSFAVQPDGYTREGIAGSELLADMKNCPHVDATGFNCVSGPYHLRQYIKELKTADTLLSVMPNAGYPTVINNRTFFGSNPEYYAEQLGQIAALGAKILGGCCGTTPEHIAATAHILRTISHTQTSADDNAPDIDAPKPLPNHFLQKAEAGKHLLAVELEPPQDTNLPGFMQKAKILQQAGVDVITVPDCPIGRARMDSSLLACKLKRELNIDVLPHMTCRDRNLNAIKALLLGLSVEGINNVLIVTGDPIPSAERDEIKSVFNFNSRMLAKYISNLNENTLVTPFQICGALNVNAVNFDVQMRLAQEKIANGVSMFLTQPILSRQAAENLQRAHQELNAKILAGIMPVVSHRNACFMNNEIAGISVGEEIVRLYENKTKEEARALAVHISVEIAKATAPYCNGYYMISPFNRVDIISDIISELREGGAF